MNDFQPKSILISRGGLKTCDDDESLIPKQQNADVSSKALQASCALTTPATTPQPCFETARSTSFSSPSEASTACCGRSGNLKKIPLVEDEETSCDDASETESGGQESLDTRSELPLPLHEQRMDVSVAAKPAAVPPEIFASTSKDLSWLQSATCSNTPLTFAATDGYAKWQCDRTHTRQHAINSSSAVGQLLAVVERGARQIVRRKLDFIFEVLLTVAFVVIGVVLWGIQGTEKIRQEQFPSVTDVMIPGAPRCDMDTPFFRDGVFDFPCYVFEGEVADDSVLARYACMTGTRRMILSEAIARGDQCVSDVAQIPFPTLSICIGHQSLWDLSLTAYLLRYLLVLMKLPSVDGIIQLQWYALATGDYVRQEALPAAQGLVDNTRFNAILSSGNLYFVGAADSTAALIQHMNATSSLFRYVNDGRVYASVEDARAASAGSRVWAIVELREMSAEGLDLVLHMSTSALPSFGTTVQKTFSGGVAYDTFEVYILSGYLTLQQAVSEFYLQFFHNIATPEIIINGYMPVVPYNKMTTVETAISSFPLLFSLVYMYSVSQQAKRIVQERELRLREAMLIMGLRQWTLYVCELLVQVAVFTFTCALIAVMLRLTFVTKSDPLIVFLLFFLFALTTIPLSGLIAAFLNHAEHAALVAPVVYFVALAPMVATSNTHGAIVTGFSVFSPSAFAAAMRVFLAHESGGGCGAAELRSARDDPTLAVIMAMLVADFFLYYVLMLYADAVVPKEWGTARHPLFFVLEPLRWVRGGSVGAAPVAAGGADGRAADGVFEDGDAAEDVVRFAGLRKEYARGGKRFVAVDNLYWGLRGSEISVLVGHNGAGKTTVLSMVTGMVAADGGDCVVYGASVRSARSAVRQELGYCPQHNILWDELTCRDHLEFYAKIKGLRGWALEDAVCRMLYETDLLEKADTAAARLSGGQKRRLSVGIAFVGGGRLVLLDEPTAGLDVGARRQVWELLKRMSHSRAVLLTTHYMDEVDLLGSRIGMLSRGHLKFSGSSAFLKSRLGVGYQLVVSVAREANTHNVDRLVFGGVRGAVVESRAATEVSYRLPEESAREFPALLRAVERGDAGGVRGYALTATTLEDVFVRVSEADAADDRAAAAAEDIELIWSCEVYRSVAWSQFKAMLVKRLWCALRDRRMQCLQIVCPIVCILIAMILGLVNFGAPQSLTMDFTMFGSEPVSELLALNCEALWGPTPRATNVDVVAVDPALHVSSEHDLKDYLADTWYHHAAPRYGAVSCWDRYVDEYNRQHIFNASLCSETSFVSSVVLLHNTSSHHQAAVNLGTYYNLRLREKAGLGSASMKYSTTLLEKPRKTTQLSYIYTVGVLALPFMLLPSAAAAWIVKERECGARSMQDMCGLSVPVYWATNFVFDVALYIFIAFVYIAVFAMFQRDDFVGGDRVGGTIVLLVVSGFTSTVYMYCWSFLFKDHGTAQAVTAIVNFFVTFVLVLICSLIYANPNYEHKTNKMKFTFRLIPSYAMVEGLLSMLSLNVELGAATSVWDMNQLGWPLVYMAAEFPLLWAVVLLADHPRVHRAVGLCGYRRATPPEVGVDEDSDVEEERRGVYEAQNNHTRADAMRLVDLRKTYGDGTVAVRGVSLSVFPSEVLGLLGTNGAGKTTTLSMLCQRIVPSGGSAYVCGYDIVSESAEALACIGCCPQTDATLELLTVEEQMRLYAGVRGIPGDHWERLISALCSLCMLTAYRKTVTCELSGGNRRKLSVALAMIGGPRVLFLDEPTAGMDPVTRRGVWAAIRRAAGYCSVVLTTHHLEEVEKVADVVAIMVRGSVQCIGDAAYLKDKFSRVVEVELVVSAPCDCALAERFVCAKFAGAVRVGGDGRRLVYHVPCDDGVGELFAVLQAHQTALHVVDYRVSATSIEETFVRVKTMAERRGQGPTLHSSEIVAGTARVY